MRVQRTLNLYAQSRNLKFLSRSGGGSELLLSNQARGEMPSKPCGRCEIAHYMTARRPTKTVILRRSMWQISRIREAGIPPTLLLLIDHQGSPTAQRRQLLQRRLRVLRHHEVSVSKKLCKRARIYLLQPQLQRPQREIGAGILFRIAPRVHVVQMSRRRKSLWEEDSHSHPLELRCPDLRRDGYPPASGLVV